MMGGKKIVWWVRLGSFGCCALALASCASSTPTPRAAVTTQVALTSPNEPVRLSALPVFTENAPTSGAESFAPAEFGVSASPRVARGPRLPRGGGYDKLGKPYTVKGRTYRPTVNPEVVQRGRASWYGEAFHGRKTANGEIYDMNHLTAAHKTMPLPSYARVTNVKNGRSVIVRVNDRGPFSNDRVIDLSKRAAYLLDYISAGTADVKVEYVGRAPLHGQDDEYLVGSFQGAPTDRLPGVQAPSTLVAGNAPAPDRFGASYVPVNSAVMPDVMPLPSNRPLRPIPQVPVSAYADMRVQQAFDGVVSDQSADWKSRR